DVVDARCGRRSRAQLPDKPFEHRHRTFDLEPHALTIIANEAGETETVGESVHRGTKANALHDAPNAYGTSLLVHSAQRLHNEGHCVFASSAARTGYFVRVRPHERGGRGGSVTTRSEARFRASREPGVAFA